MPNPPIVVGPFNNVPAPGSPIRSDWPQSISDWVAKWTPIRYANLAALKASGAPVGTIGLVMDDPTWGPLTRYAAGWRGVRTDLYNATTDGAGRVTTAISAWGFSAVNFAMASLSLQFTPDIVSAWPPSVRIAGGNLEWYFFKVVAAGTVAYDSNKAVSFAVQIHGTLTP